MMAGGLGMLAVNRKSLYMKNNTDKTVKCMMYLQYATSLIITIYGKKLTVIQQS